MQDTEYKWDADDYKAHSSAQMKWAHELIAKLNLVGNEDVLDIGCGDGKITQLLLQAVPMGSVTGLDKSEEMIALARKTYPSSMYPRLTFRKCDVNTLHDDQTYDVVFSNAALHWVKGHADLLKNIANALKPGGRMLLQMAGKGNAADILSIMDKLFESESWDSYFRNFEFPYGMYDVEEYMCWLSGLGLEIKRLELIPKDMIQKGRVGLAGWVRTTWLPYTERIPKERREEFIHTVVDTYVERHPLDERGDVHVAMVRLEVEAVKKYP